MKTLKIIKNKISFFRFELFNWLSKLSLIKILHIEFLKLKFSIGSIFDKYKIATLLL